MGLHIVGALMSFGAGVQQHYSTLLRLKQYFPFSLIDAMGSLDECKAQIARELRYQSSLDLDESTCAAPCPANPCAHGERRTCKHWHRTAGTESPVVSEFTVQHMQM